MLKNMQGIQGIGLVIYVAATVLGLKYDGQSKISQSLATSVAGEKIQLRGLPGGPFVYFAYGSNLLKQRMKINIKSAQLMTRASLTGWRLDFNRTCASWNGAVATITPHPNSTVWGNLWLIAERDLESLDLQEGTKMGWYKPISVTVNTLGHGPMEARTYVQPYPVPYVEPEMLPAERQPSLTYSKVIMYGAIESNLPVKYLKYLQRFPNNGKTAAAYKLKKLGYPFCDETSCE